MSLQNLYIKIQLKFRADLTISAYLMAKASVHLLWYKLVYHDI